MIPPESDKCMLFFAILIKKSSFEGKFEYESSQKTSPPNGGLVG